MGAVRAGDIRQLVIKGREFDVRGGDANVNVKLGGFVNEASSNGNGELHITQRRELAGFSDCPISIDDTRQDLEFIQAISNVGAPEPVTMTLTSGEVYAGALVPIGDIMKATGDGTLSLEMRGKRFEQI